MDQNINKAQHLQDRMLSLAVQIIRLAESAKLPRSVVDQVIRSVTSVGANYAEALNASSKTDFRNKVYIAKKEAAETEYWLSLMKRLQPSLELSEVQSECHTVLMILQKTVNTINGQRKSKDQ